MKFVNLLVALTLFGGLFAIWAGAAYDLGTSYSSNDASYYQELSVNYNLVNNQTSDNGVAGQIQSNIKSGDYEANTFGFITTTLDAIRLLWNIGGIYNSLGTSLITETNGYINPIFAQIFTAIVIISTVIMALIMLARMKPDTE